jgi:hypothetical protein
MYTIEEKQITEYKVDGITYKSKYDAEMALARIMERPTWAEYAKKHFPELKLYTGENLCKILEWGDPESPTCCGQRVATYSILFQVNNATCEVCGKTAINVPSPYVEGSCVKMIDESQFRWEGDDAVWAITTEDVTNSHS